jgi:hypothetical protein
MKDIDKRETRMSLLAFVVCVFGVIISLWSDCAEAKDYSAYREECSLIRDDVENWLTAEGITPDYFYLLVAESHCKDKTSKAGAVGYWQMLPATAKKYGCYDPHDLECQTHAAAKYLKRLEEKCGVENVIYCWHDGGSNFLKRGKKASSAAKGLYWQYKHLMRTDVPQE